MAPSKLRLALPVIAGWCAGGFDASPPPARASKCWKQPSNCSAVISFTCCGIRVDSVPQPNSGGSMSSWPAMACSDGPASHRQKRSQRITVCLGDTDNGLTHRRQLPRSASSGAIWRCGVAIAGERLCGHDGKGRAMADLSLLDRLVQRIASLDLSNEQYLQVITAIEHELS